MNQGFKEKIIIIGMVTEALPNTIFRVKINPDFKGLVSGQNELLAYLSGKMRINRIKILVGDKVKAEVNPYNLAKGRIVQRF